MDAAEPAEPADPTFARNLHLQPPSFYMYLSKMCNLFKLIRYRLYNSETGRRRQPFHLQAYIDEEHHMRYQLVYIMFMCTEIECSAVGYWGITFNRGIQMHNRVQHTIAFMQDFLGDKAAGPSTRFYMELKEDVCARFLICHRDGEISNQALHRSMFPFISVIHLCVADDSPGTSWTCVNREIVTSILHKRNPAATFTALVAIHAKGVSNIYVRQRGTGWTSSATQQQHYAKLQPQRFFAFAKSMLKYVASMFGQYAPLQPALTVLMSNCIFTTQQCNSPRLKHDLHMHRVCAFLRCEEWICNPHVFTLSDVDYRQPIHEVRKQVMQGLLLTSDPCEDYLYIAEKQRGRIGDPTIQIHIDAVLFEIASKYLMEGNTQGLIRCAWISKSAAPLLHRYMYGLGNSEWDWEDDDDSRHGNRHNHSVGLLAKLVDDLKEGSPAPAPAPTTHCSGNNDNPLPPLCDV